LSVPDEGYFERHLMKVILSVPDEGYFERTWLKVILRVQVTYVLDQTKFF
jgi:hypothetical protein